VPSVIPAQAGIQIRFTLHEILVLYLNSGYNIHSKLEGTIKGGREGKNRWLSLMALKGNDEEDICTRCKITTE